MAQVPHHTNRFNSSTKLLAAVVCLVLLLSMTPLATARTGQAGNWNLLTLFSQGQRNGPRQEAPEGVFPNLDEMRRTTDDRRRYGFDEPDIPDPIPSTRRRWRRGSHAAQPPGNVEVNLNALIAFASPPSATGIPWLTSRESESISNPPIGLSFSSAKDDAPNHKAAAESARIAASVALAPQSASNFAMARLAPQNRTGTPGVDLLSKNFNWSLGLIGLRGRSGLDLGLSLAYNSRVWTKSGNYLDFDLDEGTPAPGFRLGFPVVQGLFYNDQASAYFYMLITPAGQRIELRRLGTSNDYQTVDATYAQLTDYGSYFILRADGAQLKFEPANGEYRCTEVKDRNGNYLTIAYNTSGDIKTVTDTLARVLTFSYDGNSNLLKITQVWGIKSRSWATFSYGERYVGNNFPTLVSYGPTDTYINVLTQVQLPDLSRYNFEYNNSYGMVSEIRHHAKDGHERRRTTYTYSASGSDCPTVSAQREWAENWNGDVSGDHATNEEAVTNFGVDGSACTMTLPNGVIHKQFYGTGWQAGLTTQTETWSEGLRRKWTTYAWTQDNTGVSYLLNPRLIETNVNDVEGNLKRVTISYSPPAYAAYSLPYEVIEYANDGVTMLRRTYTDYNLSSTYTDRRIIGLVSAVHVVDHTAGAYVSKTTLDYDWGGEYLAGLSPAPIRHDGANYGAGFVSGRGNLTSVTRWDVTDINNASKAIAVRRTGYNITGAAAFMRDALNHQTSIAYTDSYSDSVNRNTYAYPTTLTDADNSQATTQYKFDFGAVTRTQGPPPAGQSQGATQTMSYDAAGRIQWVNNVNNGAWKFITYSDRGDAVMSQETINATPPSFWRITVVDGANRVRSLGGDHPGSDAGYSAVFTYYDSMGRVWKRSNPTETTGMWAPAGDDYTAGWVHTLQTYDWQGRPLVTTHPSITTDPSETTTTELSYGGCGCAGGQVVTQIDEGTLDGGVPKRREQKLYSDVLGRTVKTEVRNWQGGTPYSATVNTYNARDQITKVRQYAGAEGSGTYQDTDISYDGYGRVKTKHAPEQQLDPNNSASTDHTTWDYNADDTVHKITDARGAISTFGYNNRHLVTGIVYTLLPGVPTTGPSAVEPAAPTSYAYDPAGNRTLMTDGTGAHSYQYDQLSRITSETRTFTGLPGQSYTLSYGYNLAGQVTTLTEPAQFGSSATYAYDSAGRLNGVTGSGLVGGTSQLASGLKYRAWNAVKQMEYGNGLRLNNEFNGRLQLTNYQVKVPGTPVGQGERARTSYQYEADGRIRQTTDFTDQKFDRYYSYDHAGRLKTYLHPYPTPSDQAFSYDEFDHMTVRANGSWRYYTDTGSDYQNNRNVYTISVPRVYPSCCPPQPSYWTYNADGQVTHDHNKEYTYDASGNKTRVFETTEVGISLTKKLWLYQDYDGNGVRAKRVEQTQYNQGPYAFKTSYYLRSSVLNGKVITELNESGQRRETNIYANGATLAQQKDNQVYWVHVDPITQSTRETQTDGAIAQRFEFDPLGNDVPLSDPLPQEMPPDYEFTGNYGSSGNPYDGPSGCMVDGFPMPCNLMWGMANFGRPANLSGGSISVGGSADSAVWVDEWENYDDGTPTTSDQNGNPIVPALASRNVGRFAIVPAGGRIANSVNLRSTGSQKTQWPGVDSVGIGRDLETMLKTGECGKFVETLINRLAAKTKNPFVSDYALALFDLMLSQGGFVRGGDADKYKVSATVGGHLVYGNGKRRGDASVHLNSHFDFGSSDPQIQANSVNAIDAFDTLHELIHHAGKNGYYTDRQVAVTLSEMTGTPGLPVRRKGESDREFTGRNSSYFSSILRSNCPVLSGSR